jgi:amino acid adenylation domain-containing protein/thioester reductase-like protein
MTRANASAQKRLEGLSEGKAKLLELLVEKRMRYGATIEAWPRDFDAGPMRLPTSAAQQRLWLIDQLEGAGAAYTVPVEVCLRGILDEVALHHALDVLVQRHEILRTVFVSVDGEPAQEIAPEGTFDLKQLDLSGCGELEREAQVQIQRDQEVQGSFDLSTGPLIRGRLLKTAPEEHVLLMTMHHIVFDGWSLRVFGRELTALYGAFREGRANPLKPLRIQYADFALFQRQWLQAGALNEQLRYWQERLQGVASQLELPTDRPRPPTQSHRCATLQIPLGSALSGAVKALARRHEMTLFMTLFACWSILLSRLSGQEDIAIGTPVANRQQPELEHLIGFFVNTLVLRIKVSGSLLLEEFLEQVREVALGAYDHQDVPFEQVVEAVQPERALSRNPLFQVMLVVQNAPEHELQFPGLAATLRHAVNERSKFDLLMSFEDRGDEIVGSLDYSAELFDSGTIERWAANFLVLLKDMTEDAAARIGELRLLPDVEKRLIESFNAPSVYPQNELIQELFEQQASRTPDAVALVHEQHAVSYAELNGRANQLARYLRQKGIGPDKLVGLCAVRGIELVVGLLGILKAGGAYVPLDPNYPLDRLAYMLEDAAPKVLLIQEELRTVLPRTAAEVITLDTDWTEIARQPAGHVAIRPEGAHSHQLAYVIYTSGSTGKPKGVMVEHAHVLRLFAATARWFNFGERDVWTLFHSFAFDFSVWELWGALLYGGKLVVVPYLTARSPNEFYRLLCKQKVTVLNQTPSAFAQLIDEQARSESRHSLRVVIFGGEALEFRMLRTWVKSNGAEHPQLVNMYGITETTVHVTYRLLTAYDIESGRGSVIGRPIPDLQVHLLDGYRQRVPVGVTGEIYVGGGGVARGYLNRPELTAERFIADPFNDDPKARLYKSGDLARWRTDGSIEYLGRNDHQVKIRGFRIELGEIEAQLMKHQQVKEAVVIAREDVPGERRLVAYVIPSDSSNVAQRPSIDDLRAHLKAMLPEHMVPGAFAILERMPLTLNGKLDIRALPAPASDDYANQQYEAPQGEEEEAVASIWQELLGVERIGRNSNFFQLGGHSMLAVKALFRINQICGSSLGVVDLYRNPTIGDMAARIRGGSAGQEFVDLEREAILDDDIVARPDVHDDPANGVLLTGSTGFVGRFLLAQLLRETNATIYCLVRAQSELAASARLKATLSAWDLWSDEYHERIVAVPGDLRLPRLGLRAATYQLLCDATDTIYHCATSMNHLETYAMAKPANVEAAKELLRIATRGRRKLVNYISSASVFSPATAAASRVVNESSSIDGERHSTASGYAASKWVAEKIFMLADAKGIPSNIFRVGLVWADERQGRYDELQHVYRILKSCLLSGYGIENYRCETPPTPVDYVARAVVYLANRHRRGHGIFHISSSNQMIDDLFGRCNEIAGTSLELVPFYDWTCEIKRLHHSGRSLPIVPLIEFAFGMDEKSFYEREQAVKATRVLLDCDRTHRELERAGIVAPSLNDDLLQACVQSMCSRDQELREWIACKNSPSDMRERGHGIETA